MVETFTEGQPAVAQEAPPPEDNRIAPPIDKSSPSHQLREAARALVARRKELREQAAAKVGTPAAPQAEPEAPPTESPPQEAEAAQETGPGETQEASPAETLPPIEPPRAWKAEDKSVFDALPRDIQEKLSENERVRESDYSKRLQEVSERQKAHDAELSQMQAARQQYQEGLNSALQMTLSNNEFADVRSMDDIEQMARDDWPRWVRYQTYQQKVGLLREQLQQVEAQSYQQQVSEWAKFAEQQDNTFSEKYPDAKALKDDAVSYLKDVGFSKDEIGRYWNSAAWRDYRMQSVILDAVRYRSAKTKADQAIKRPVPAVQKPGVATPKVNPFQAEIAKLEAKGGLSLKEATRLDILRRNAAKA